MVTDKPKSLKGSGWRKISTPEDLEKSIVTMLNKILMSKDPLSHAGRFASLANCWLNARRLELEEGEWQAIMARLELIEQAQAFQTPEEAFDFKKSMAELKELMRVYEANC